MSTVLRFLPLVLFVLIASFFYFVLDVRKDKPVSELASALIDRPFPKFSTSELISQEHVDNSKLITGEPTLVNIWASWCAACRAEHPYLAQLAAEGVRIIGINYKDDRESALAWLNQYKDVAKFHIVDRDGRLGINLGVYGAPETYLIDGEGFIRYKRVGIMTEDIWQSILPLYTKLKQASRDGKS